LRSEPEALARFAHALLTSGEKAEGLRQARLAFSKKPSGVPALVAGLAGLGEGDLAAAEDALRRAENSLEGAPRVHAFGLLGLALFWRGNLTGALTTWKSLDERGALDPSLLDFLAVAAASSGDEALARAALTRTPDAEAAPALLARARVELTLARPVEALAALDRVKEAPAELRPLLDASRGRALRMLGRFEAARQALAPIADVPLGMVGAMAISDLGRMASDEGRHEDAAVLFEKAHGLDPHSAEAEEGLRLARQRTEWRTAVTAAAKSEVEAARGEAESMRRAFAERERELEGLRRRLEQMERAASDAEREARRAQRTAEEEKRRQLERELERREREVPERAEEALAEAFGDALARCPGPVLDLLRVAERTYQKALYTELHPASIAVLYAGALERGLYQLVVQPFDRSLLPAERQAFLKGAVRELRAGRPEYFDRFVEAFERERRPKPPSLGEIARALARRGDPHLRPLSRFLAARFALADAFFDTLAAFVERAKLELRDPVAHGRALEVGQGDLTRFRKELLFELPGAEGGALPALVRGLRGG
jgi:tetratricopeptide (TPR) repeat protein